MKQEDSPLYWVSYILIALVFSLAMISYINYENPEKLQKTGLSETYILVGPGVIRNQVREPHRIEIMERASMPKAIGWDGFDQDVENEYLISNPRSFHQGRSKK